MRPLCRAVCLAARRAGGLATVRPPRRHGMTLAEVLAAITILAVVLPVAMQGIGMATSLASVTRQRAAAVALAQSKLNELVATGQWQTAQLSGDFEPQWPGYRWEAQAADWEEANLHQVQVSVSWSSRGSPRQVVLSTLVYTNPTQGGIQ